MHTGRCFRYGAFEADPASPLVRAGAAHDEERALLLWLLPGAHSEDEEPAGRRQPRGRGGQQQAVRHLRLGHGHHCHKETENILLAFTVATASLSSELGMSPHSVGVL